MRPTLSIETFPFSQVHLYWKVDSALCVAKHLIRKYWVINWNVDVFRVFCTPNILMDHHLTKIAKRSKKGGEVQRQVSFSSPVPRPDKPISVTEDDWLSDLSSLVKMTNLLLNIWLGVFPHEGPDLAESPDSCRFTLSILPATSALPERPSWAPTKCPLNVGVTGDYTKMSRW